MRKKQDQLELLNLDEENVTDYEEQEEILELEIEEIGETDEDEEEDEIEEINEIEENEEYYYDEDEDEFYPEEWEEEEWEEEEETEEDEFDEEDSLWIEEEQRNVGRTEVFDKVIVAAGALILMLALGLGGLYLYGRSADRQTMAFSKTENGPAGVSIIGESGMLAMADATTATRALAEAAIASSGIGHRYEEKELDAEGNVKVKMHISSVQRDLKVKFVNEKTGKLIPNILFEVEITDAAKKNYILKDEDKDGIIYQADAVPGKCSISMREIKDAENYIISTESQSATIKDKIEYKKVDVADEIKKESEVNVAIEDTKKQETVVESSLTDTVDWVESSKTSQNDTDEGAGNGEYEEVSKDKITDPLTMASAVHFMKFAAVDDPRADVNLYDEQGNVIDMGPNRETGSGENTQGEQDRTQQEQEQNNGGENNGNGEQNSSGENPNVPQEIKVKLSQTGIPMKQGESITLEATTEPAGNSVTWRSTNEAVVTVQNGVVTATGAGAAEIWAVTATGNKAVCGITVAAAETDKTKPVIALSAEKGKLFVGKTLQLTAEVKNTEDKSVTWKSGAETVATVSPEGTVTAVSPGTAVITVISNGDNSVTASCEITVKEDPAKDTATKLKDNDGNQLYVADGAGGFREAVYADYFTAEKFYKKMQNTEYKYTGWQTIEGKTYYYDANGNKVTGEQVIQGAKYSFDGNGVLATASGNMGIDVSKWNGKIDWNAVRNSGVSYVIIRCGYRGSTTGALIEDPMFRSNIQGASAAGLKVGVYFFTQAVNEVEAVEEASMVAGLISGYHISYPVFLDVEASGGRADGISSETRTAVCRAFCQTMQNSGYTAGIYANSTWFTSRFQAKSLTDYKIWLAQYAAAPTYKATRYDMWQYSAKGSVAGIKGKVDMNISYLGQ